MLMLVGAQPIVAGGFSAGGRWAIRFPQPNKIKFFALVKGNCWLCIDAATAPIHVQQGDVFLLTGERSFVLASAPDVVPVDASGLFSGNVTKTAKIGDGSDCVQIGGHVRLARPDGTLLLDVLPPLVHISAHHGQAAVLQWLLTRLVTELAFNLPGSALASTYLTQLMFVEILRAAVPSFK